MSISVGYIGRSVPGLPGVDEIIALCRQNGYNTNGFKYPPDAPIAYIKYGGRLNICEVRTQCYVLNAFNEITPAPGVKAPEVYLVCEYKSDTYLVIENIHGYTVAELLQDRSINKNWMFDLVAKAVTHLLAFPVPSDDTLGQLEVVTFITGFVRITMHQQSNPRSMSCRTISTRFSPLEAQEIKSIFSNEQFCFCYSDIWEHNFIITEADQTHVLDFGHAAFLPKSFMSLVLHRPGTFLISRMSSRIAYPESPNLNALRRASYTFKIAFNVRLGNEILDRYATETDKPISQGNYIDPLVGSALGSIMPRWSLGRHDWKFKADFLTKIKRYTTPL